MTREFTSIETRTSRRRLIKAAIGGAAIAAAAIIPVDAWAQKVSKKVAAYQAKPKNGHTCAKCKFFLKPHSCKLVSGTINSTGWCTYFQSAG